MKALLIIDNDATALDFAACLADCGCECIRYRQPLKAMDNIEEIDPDLFIISAIDFPRHWKALLQFAVNTCGKKPVFFLIGENFSGDEEKKASYLAVHEIIPAEMKTDEERQALILLLEKYGFAAPANSPPADSSVPTENQTVPPAESEPTPESTLQTADEPVETGVSRQKRELEFLFIHPHSGVIITGKTVSRTEDGIIFKPDWEDETADLLKGERIISCRLYNGSECINPAVEVLQSGKELELLFI